MNRSQLFCHGIATALLVAIALPASAQSFQVQCPNSTLLHPTPVAIAPADLNKTYNPDNPATNPGVSTANPNGGSIKCQQISGGDGFITMGDGTEEYTFSFGPLSGLKDIVDYGLPGTQPAEVFNQNNRDGSGHPLANLTRSGDNTENAPYPGYAFNGAIGLVPDPEPLVDAGTGDPVCPSGGGTGACLTGHVDPRLIMDIGTMNGSFPAPLFAIDEDDEFFLTLTNVGMIMRPDLFEQHTVHFHGYPNASAFYDGVPDASVAINIGASFTYYYLSPDAGTYLWHCHITPPEHLEMGMVGQVYVRPRQNRATGTQTLFENLQAQQLNPRTKCDNTEILCTNPLPAAGDNGRLHADNSALTGVTGSHELYTYNDGDGSTAYDVEYPINIHGFDPNFHFVGMTFNPESFTDLKDKFFMLNGRSYPDTVGGHTCIADDPVPQCNGKAAGTIVAGPIGTQGPDGLYRYSQVMRDVINIPAGGRALLRLSDLNVTEFHTLASLGIPMLVVGRNAKLLRDQDGNNMAYRTNSVTLGGGESMDVILDACQQRNATTGACTTPGYTAGQIFYLYTPKLDELSNDAENFGGLMTEIRVCTTVDPISKACTIS